MKLSLPSALLAFCLMTGAAATLPAAPIVERDWIILNFQYKGARPGGIIETEGLERISTSPRIYSGLVSSFTRINLAGGEHLDLPAGHPLRTQSGKWRRPGQLEEGDRIRYLGRMIRVLGTETREREQAVRLYIVESKGAKDEITLNAGRLTEDRRDLVAGKAEEGFCSGTCAPRLGLIHTKVLAGARGWFSSFFAIKDFRDAYQDLNSGSRRRQRRAVTWIGTNGTPKQQAAMKLFAHNAGWKGMGLATGEYYRNLGLLIEENPNQGTALNVLEREVLRHHYGREVDREHGSDEAVAEVEEEDPWYGPVVIWPAIGRSAVLPGWGNTYLGHKASGYTYSGAFLGAGAVAVLEYNRAVELGEEFEAKQLQADLTALLISGTFQQDTMLIQAAFLNQDANATLKNFRRAANNAIGAGYFAILVWSTSLLHTSWNATSWPDPEGEDPEARTHLFIQPGPAGDGLQFSVMVRF